MKKIMIAVMASLVTTMMIQASWPLGTDFDKQINIFQRVDVPLRTYKVIVAFNGGYMQQYGLDAGTWDTEASISLFVHGTNGVIVYYWAGISAYDPIIAFNDGHTVPGSATIQNGRLDIPIPVVSRDVDIRTPQGTTKPLYLVLWVQVDPWNISLIREIKAYGFMGTRKVHAYQN